MRFSSRSHNENLAEERSHRNQVQGSDDSGTSEGHLRHNPRNWPAAAVPVGVKQSGAAAESTKTVTTCAAFIQHAFFAQLADLIKEVSGGSCADDR
jgi:hypothetical protein